MLYSWRFRSKCEKSVIKTMSYSTCCSCYILSYACATQKNVQAHSSYMICMRSCRFAYRRMYKRILATWSVGAAVCLLTSAYCTPQNCWYLLTIYGMYKWTVTKEFDVKYHTLLLQQLNAMCLNLPPPYFTSLFCAISRQLKKISRKFLHRWGSIFWGNFIMQFLQFYIFSIMSNFPVS